MSYCSGIQVDKECVFFSELAYNIIINKTIQSLQKWQCHPCADPEKFCQRGSTTLKTFFKVSEGGGGSKWRYKRAIFSPPAKRHLHGVSQGCWWWSNIEFWLGSFVIFQGIRISLAKNPYIFVIVPGGPNPLPPPPSGPVHAITGDVKKLKHKVCKFEQVSYFVQHCSLTLLKMFRTWNQTNMYYKCNLSSMISLIQSCVQNNNDRIFNMALKVDRITKTWKRNWSKVCGYYVHCTYSCGCFNRSS